MNMIGTLFLQPLSPEHLLEHIDAYMAISADASPWTKDNFLKDLPDKWTLSFSLWEDVPVAYCIMSRRKGVIHIHQFMVAPYARGDGIGAAMLAETLKRGASTLKVAPDNEGAIRFYCRHGFQEVAKENEYLVMKLMAHGPKNSN